MTTLLDLPPELRALIFERLSWSCILKISTAVPSVIPDLTTNLCFLEDEEPAHRITLDHLRSFPRLRIVEPEILIDAFPEAFPYHRIKVRARSHELANDLLKRYQCQDRSLKVSLDGTGFINWDQETLTWSCQDISHDIGPNSSSNPCIFVLVTGEIEPQRYIIIDTPLIRSVIGQVFCLNFRNSCPRIGYHFDTPSYFVYGEVAGRIIVGLEAFLGQNPDTEYPHLTEIDFPLSLNSVYTLMRICPNLVKIGFVPISYIDVNHLLRMYPQLTLILYCQDGINLSSINHPERVVLV